MKKKNLAHNIIQYFAPFMSGFYMGLTKKNNINIDANSVKLILGLPYVVPLVSNICKNFLLPKLFQNEEIADRTINRLWLNSDSFNKLEAEQYVRDIRDTKIEERVGNATIGITKSATLTTISAALGYGAAHLLDYVVMQK